MRVTLNFLSITFLILIFGCKDNKPEQGKLFIYEKSNIDGTNKGSIAIYYLESGLIESFKWHEGNNHATMVKAWMDNNTNTVSQFKVFGVDHLAKEELRGSLEVMDNGTIKITLGEHEQLYQQAPLNWHSYDFDFTSLSYAFQSLKDLPRSFNFQILDLDLQESPPLLKDFGIVKMKFLNEENKWSRDLMKYEIGGPGLDNKGGYIWFDKSDGFLVGFEIEKPDEPGYQSGKLLLKTVSQIKVNEWVEFKRKAVNPE